MKIYHHMTRFDIQKSILYNFVIGHSSVGCILQWLESIITPRLHSRHTVDVMPDISVWPQNNFARIKTIILPWYEKNFVMTKHLLLTYLYDKLVCEQNIVCGTYTRSHPLWASVCLILLMIYSVTMHVKFRHLKGKCGVAWGKRIAIRLN